MCIVLTVFIALFTSRCEWGRECFRQKSMWDRSPLSSALLSPRRGVQRSGRPALGYQEGLGSPWFTLSSYPVYLPWRLFEWWYAYEAYAPEIFERAGAVSAGGGVAGALFAVVNSVWRARQNQFVTTYGSARWATPREIVGAGLFRAKGVFLG